jgi:hypothetical protein
MEAEMAYVIVNDFEGGMKEQYDATTAVLAEGQQPHRECLRGGEVVGCQRLALDDRDRGSLSALAPSRG